MLIIYFWNIFPKCSKWITKMKRSKRCWQGANRTTAGNLPETCYISKMSDTSRTYGKKKNGRDSTHKKLYFYKLYNFQEFVPPSTFFQLRITWGTVGHTETPWKQKRSPCFILPSPNFALTNKPTMWHTHRKTKETPSLIPDCEKGQFNPGVLLLQHKRRSMGKRGDATGRTAW